VHFVSNVTDIEDKIIKRAADEGRSTVEVAAHYETVWWDTMGRLGIERPDDDPTPRRTWSTWWHSSRPS